MESSLNDVSASSFMQSRAGCCFKPCLKKMSKLAAVTAQGVEHGKATTVGLGVQVIPCILRHHVSRDLRTQLANKACELQPFWNVSVKLPARRPTIFAAIANSSLPEQPRLQQSCWTCDPRHDPRRLKNSCCSLLLRMLFHRILTFVLGLWPNALSADKTQPSPPTQHVHMERRAYQASNDI